MAKKQNSLSAADAKALAKVTKTVTDNIMALKRRPRFQGLTRFTPIIKQDPGNPDQVIVCFEIITSNGDGTFTVRCICTNGTTDDFCSATPV